MIDVVLVVIYYYHVSKIRSTYIILVTLHLSVLFGVVSSLSAISFENLNLRIWKYAWEASSCEFGYGVGREIVCFGKLVVPTYHL